jgi:hypothetical protein
VLVSYVPEVDGDPKAGVDDYLTAGGDFDELLNSARGFELIDIGDEHLSKDELESAQYSKLRYPCLEFGSLDGACLWITEGRMSSLASPNNVPPGRCACLLDPLNSVYQKCEVP